jgi:hypothetical protein
MISLADNDSHRYIAPPDPGRAARIARSDREYARRCRVAAEYRERDPNPINSAALRSLRAEVRRLTDHPNEERRARANLAAQIAELTDALDYLRDQIKEVRRGQDQPRG